ncbi:MAG: DUF3631 domain-containing protein [Gammaproteobacteria bacterium]|nr:DUF3631 domain-containing protein [Gammaproteobacteria bacterium]
MSTDPAPIPDAVLHDPVIRERIETEARQCARESESAPAAIVKRAIDCAEIGDPGAPFTANVLAAWRKLRKSDLAEFQRLRAAAKTAGVPLGELDRALRANGEGDSVAGSACDLPDVEPWTHPVDGAELLDRIAAETRRYLVLPFSAAEAVALWVIHAHAHNSAAVSPILAATSPTPECGKTTLLTLLGMLVPRPLSAANITAATVFRAVEKWRPTLLVDEADTFLRDRDELRGVLNSGHARGSAWVIRTVGEDFEPRRFATWAPKAVAMIGRLPPTLDSRAIHIELRRMTPADRVETLRVERAGHLPELARKAARFTADHTRQLRDADPDLPAMLRGRPADNWRPLIAIADVAGGDWPTRARKTAETFSAGRSEQTAGIMLLEDVRQIIGERDRLTSADLAEALGQLEERPWPEWGRTGRPITPRQIARLLEPFGLRPVQAKVGGRNLRTYVRSDFADAWARYLPLPDPLSPSATPLPANTGAGFSQFASATSAEVVADRKSPKRSAGTGCSGVADRDPHEGKRDTERPPAWMPV